MIVELSRRGRGRGGELHFRVLDAYQVTDFMGPARFRGPVPIVAHQTRCELNLRVGREGMVEGGHGYGIGWEAQAGARRQHGGVMFVLPRSQWERGRDRNWRGTGIRVFQCGPVQLSLGSKRRSR